MRPGPGLAYGAAGHGLHGAWLADRAEVDVNEDAGEHDQRRDVVNDIADCNRPAAEYLREPHNDAGDHVCDGLVQKLEDFRSTLVSVKEGGMITGEKKLREKLGELYGGVNGYCGRPTQSQVDSTAFFQKKLDGAASQFQSITGPALQSLNMDLQGKSLEPIKAMTREEWEKKQK
jgi:hypothetical protein